MCEKNLMQFCGNRWAGHPGFLLRTEKICGSCELQVPRAQQWPREKVAKKALIQRKCIVAVEASDYAVL